MRKYHEFEIDYFQDEDGFFTARVPAIPGCIVSGKSMRQAYRNAVDAIESCLEARHKVGAMRLRKSRYAGLNVYRHLIHA
jgi:predicted RNase H-like HicB family nuclease